VYFAYDMDTKVIPTIGGRVVQAYGATLGDMTVQGMLGQERGGSPRESWQLAEDFQTAISGIVRAQSTPPTDAQRNGTDLTPMHQPVRFYFNDDTPDRRAAGLPIHNWDLMVYVKSLKDLKSDFTVAHETGKFSYAYTLTLFIVEDNTGSLVTGIVDDFITSLADGVGWAQTTFNGPLTTDDVSNYLAKNSPDGTIHGLLLQELAQSSQAFNDIKSQIAGGVSGITVPGALPGLVGPLTPSSSGAAAGGSNNGGVPGAVTGPALADRSKIGNLKPGDPGYAQALAAQTAAQGSQGK
jgi:hypothetical protein